jgi:hypothetical protein
MEQEISLVEMTEQIIGKKQNFTRCGLGRTCALCLGCLIFFLPLLWLCSLFAVVDAFNLPQGNLNRGTVIYGKAVPI